MPGTHPGMPGGRISLSKDANPMNMGMGMYGSGFRQDPNPMNMGKGMGKYGSRRMQSPHMPSSSSSSHNDDPDAFAAASMQAYKRRQARSLGSSKKGSMETGLYQGGVGVGQSQNGRTLKAHKSAGGHQERQHVDTSDKSIPLLERVEAARRGSSMNVNDQLSAMIEKTKAAYGTGPPNTGARVALDMAMGAVTAEEHNNMRR